MRREPELNMCGVKERKELCLILMPQKKQRSFMKTFR